MLVNIKGAKLLYAIFDNIDDVIAFIKQFKGCVQRIEVHEVGNYIVYVTPRRC